jgi:hypothetical protein
MAIGGNHVGQKVGKQRITNDVERNEFPFYRINGSAHATHISIREGGAVSLGKIG